MLTFPMFSDPPKPSSRFRRPAITAPSSNPSSLPMASQYREQQVCYQYFNGESRYARSGKLAARQTYPQVIYNQYLAACRGNVVNTGLADAELQSQPHCNQCLRNCLVSVHYERLTTLLVAIDTHSSPRNSIGISTYRIRQGRTPVANVIIYLQPPKLRTGSPEFLDKRLYLINERGTNCWSGVRSRFAWSGRRRCCIGSRGGHRRSNGRLVQHPALKDDRRAHAHTAHQDDHRGIKFRLRFRVRNINERRRDHLIDRFFLGGRLLRLRRGQIWFGVEGALAQILGGGQLPNLRLRIRPRSCGCARLRIGWRVHRCQVAEASASAGFQRFQLPIGQQHVTGLRDHDALSRKLLLQSYGTLGGAHAHHAGTVETHQEILVRVADGQRLRLDLRGVDREDGRLLNVRVHGAGFESHGDGPARFQDGEMRRTANGDQPAFDQVDARFAGLYPYIAAAAQHRFNLPVHHFHAHGSSDGDGLPFDHPDAVARRDDGGRFVRAARRAADRGARRRSRGTTRGAGARRSRLLRRAGRRSYRSCEEQQQNRGRDTSHAARGSHAAFASVRRGAAVRKSPHGVPRRPHEMDRIAHPQELDALRAKRAVSDARAEKVNAYTISDEPAGCSGEWRTPNGKRQHVSERYNPSSVGRRRAARRHVSYRWGVRTRSGGQRALRHAPAGAVVVAAYTNSLHRRRGVQRDSPAGADAALRSSGLAACRTGLRAQATMHLGVLASRDRSHCVVAQESRRGGDEHHGLRRTVDAQGHRVAGIRHRARQLVARRLARPGGDGTAPERGPRLRLYHRWATRPALRRQARSGHARAQERLPHHGVSHRRGPRQNLRKDLGSFPNAGSVCARGHAFRSANLRAARRGCRRNGSQARGNAARTRARQGYSGGLVFDERSGAPETSRGIRKVTSARASRRSSRLLLAPSLEGRRPVFSTCKRPTKNARRAGRRALPLLGARAFGERHRNIDFLAAAVHIERDGVAGALVVQQNIHIELVGHFCAIHANDNVPADVNAAHARLRGAIAPANAGLGRRPVRGHGFYQQAVLHRQIESAREIPAHWKRFHSQKRGVHAAIGHQVVGDVFRGVDGNGEADARGGAAGRVNRGVDADDFAMRIDERAAGISAVDGRVGLDGFVDESGLAGLHRAADGAHHPGGQRGLKAEGIADGQNFLSDLQGRGIAESQGRQRFALGIDFDQCHVVALIRANDFCRVARLVAKDYLNALRFLDDVKISEDVAARVDHETGTGAFHGHGVHEEIVLRGFGEDVRNGRRSLAVDAHIDQFVVGEGAIARSSVGVCRRGCVVGGRWDGSYVDGLVLTEACADPVRAEQNDQRCED